MKPSDDLIVSATEPTGANRKKVWMQKRKNLFNVNTMVELEENIRYYENGNIMPVEGFSSIKIPVMPNTMYISNDLEGISNLTFWDKNMNYISGLPYTTSDKKFTTPSNCKYITIAVPTAKLHNLCLVQGSTATDYEEYIEPKIYIKNDNDVYEEFISKEDTLEKYSTTEQKIGNWIDGKPLYRKVFKITGQQFGYNSMNVDEIVDIKVKSYCNDILFSTGRYNNSADMFTWYLNHIQKIIAIDIGSQWLPSYTGSTIILEYTKTTD